MYQKGKKKRKKERKTHTQRAKCVFVHLYPCNAWTELSSRKGVDADGLEIMDCECTYFIKQ